MTLLTVDEAAAQLRVHRETIRRMIRRGDLAAIKIGNVYRVDLSDLKPTRRARVRPAIEGDTRLTRYARPEWRHRQSHDSRPAPH